MSGISVQELVTNFTKENAEKFMEHEITIQNKKPSKGYSILIKSVSGHKNFSRSKVVEILDEWGLDEKYKDHAKEENGSKAQKENITPKKFSERLYSRLTKREKQITGLSRDEFSDIFVQLFNSRK